MDSEILQLPEEVIIDDVVSFSLCSLCSIRQRELYPDEFHESFRNQNINCMLSHFGIPEKTNSSIKFFTQEDEFTFLSSIKQNFKPGPLRLVKELVLLSVKSGFYDARSHYLIIDVAERLGIPRELVEIHCESIYDLLLKAQKGDDKITTDPAWEKAREKRDTRDKIKKYFLIGLGSLAGGAVIGVTGGLAAPVVASAFAGVIGAGTIVMSSAAAGVVGSLFGVAGAGLTASKMNKRIGDLEEFSFESLNPGHEQTSLTITIAISGWINKDTPHHFAAPWRSLCHSKEQYCLCYESKYLLELSQAMDYLLSFVVSYATQEALKYTFLAGVMAAIAWPTALISIANIIDNPWDCCLGRSAQAGKHLADVLMSRQQGKRPASLIGFSLGARVIFFCLREMSKRKDCEGIIGDVVILGAPVTASVDQWEPLGRVISGRIINGYSSSDWLLKFLYRTSSAAIRVAGLQEIGWKDRRLTNVDLTHIVTGHMDYYKKLTEILDYVSIRIGPPQPWNEFADESAEGMSLAALCNSLNLDDQKLEIGARVAHVDSPVPTCSSDSGLGDAIVRSNSESTTNDGDLSAATSQQSLHLNTLSAENEDQNLALRLDVTSKPAANCDLSKTVNDKLASDTKLPQNGGNQVSAAEQDNLLSDRPRVSSDRCAGSEQTNTPITITKATPRACIEILRGRQVYPPVGQPLRRRRLSRRPRASSSSSTECFLSVYSGVRCHRSRSA